MCQHRTLAALIAGLTFAACSATDPAPDGGVGPAPGPQPELDCRHLDAGPVRIPFRANQGITVQLRNLGYDGWTDVRTVTERWRDAQGNLQERVVAHEGYAWRYANPACRMRR